MTRAARRHPRAPDDLVQPFQIEASGLRGRLVRLGRTVDEVLTRHSYPEPVATVLAEALASTAVLAGGLKFDGVFSLQTKTDGALRLLVADVTSAGGLRAYAQFDADAVQAAASGVGRPSLPRLMGTGYLAFTVDQGPHTDRYQGIVELTGATLADCIHHYFRQSEQVEAAVKLAAGRGADGGWRAGALMIQRLPEPSPGAATESDEEGWRRAAAFMSSSTTAELIDPELSPHDLLYRLFHEDGVRVYKPTPVRFGCRCSRRRVSEMLRSLPRAEVEAMKEGEQVVVTCEFCNSRYPYDPGELDALYATDAPSAG